jgi:hypothetical protein
MSIKLAVIDVGKNVKLRVSEKHIPIVIFQWDTETEWMRERNIISLTIWATLDKNAPFLLEETLGLGGREGRPV